MNEVVIQRFIIESINNFKLGGLFVVGMELCIDFVLMDSGRIDCTDMSVSARLQFQSHQIFHVFVVIAAYVHYHGITKLASYRLTLGDCLTAHIEADFSFEF